MKYKKYSYILVLVLMLLIGINKTYADTDDMCYYQTVGEQTLLEYNNTSGKFKIKKRGSEIVGLFQNEPLINYGKGKTDSETNIYVKSIDKGTCPNYVVYRRKSRFGFDSEGIWGFVTESSANNFLEMSDNVQNMTTWLLTYKNEDGSKITSEQFYNNLNSSSSSSSTSGGNNKNQTGLGGTDVNVDCNELFGSKSDPNSLRYLINEVLSYPKIIVPILVILLGTLDFAKAVIASKEDEMKKAQSTFVKRLIIGVAIFFVPAIVDILMSFADIVWEGLGYTSCGL